MIQHGNFTGFLIASLIMISHWSPTLSAASFNEATQGFIELRGTANRYSGPNPGTITGVLGQGSFTYAAQSVELKYGPGVPPSPFGDDTLTLDASQDFRRVTDIHLSLLGQDFNQGYVGAGSGQVEFAVDYLWQVPGTAGDTFPGGSGVKPGLVLEFGGAGRPYSQFRQQDGWRFGFTRDTFLDLGADGKWFYVNPSQVTMGSGTWTARTEPVPEPLTMAASALAVAVGIGFRRYAKRSAG